MTRIDPVHDDTESPEVQKVFERIRARGDQPSPLYRTLARAPGLLEPWAAFANALRFSTLLERSSSELVILRLAQMSDAPYQWAYHVRPALAAGLTPTQLASLSGWRDSTHFDSDQRAALAYAEAMFHGTVPDADFAALRTRLGERRVLELTLTVAFYVNVGRVLRALQIEVDDSHRALLP